MLENRVGRINIITIRPTANKPELTTLDSIDIEKLERWTLKPRLIGVVHEA